MARNSRISSVRHRSSSLRRSGASRFRIVSVWGVVIPERIFHCPPAIARIESKHWASHALGSPCPGVESSESTPSTLRHWPRFLRAHSHGAHRHRPTAYRHRLKVARALSSAPMARSRAPCSRARASRDTTRSWSTCGSPSPSGGCASATAMSTPATAFTCW